MECWRLPSLTLTTGCRFRGSEKYFSLVSLNLQMELLWYWFVFLTIAKYQISHSSAALTSMHLTWAALRVLLQWCFITAGFNDMYDVNECWHINTLHEEKKNRDMWTRNYVTNMSTYQLWHLTSFTRLHYFHLTLFLLWCHHSIVALISIAFGISL